jgi:hypothetical protein
MQPGYLGRPFKKPESQRSMRDRMIEDALEFYEIEYKTSKPVEDIQVSVPTTTTFIINCAQLLLTEARKGST